MDQPLGVNALADDVAGLAADPTAANPTAAGPAVPGAEPSGSGAPGAHGVARAGRGADAHGGAVHPDVPGAARRSPLPGDLTPRVALERMIRVDHAGEYGAKRIYQGQLAVLRSSDKADILRHMQAQEQVHLDTFAGLIATRRVRPTLLLPLWHVAGWALGAATAAMGERAAMACTVAVEEAIDEHYAAQHESLGDDEAALRDTIDVFREEELEHRDIGLENEAELTPGYKVLCAIIKTGCKVAIAVSERV